MSQDWDAKTPDNIYLGRQPFLPLELILRILQPLRYEYAALLQLSLTCKLLHAEVQPLLYNSLDKSYDLRGGPPPEAYTNNPSLAKFIRTITYMQYENIKENEAMEKILAGAFAHRMPNLTSMTLRFDRIFPQNFLSKGEFQLEELWLDGELYPADLEVTLWHQKRLKKLRSKNCNRGLPPIPLSVCPELHTLEADISVIEAFLPLHHIHTLIWDLEYYNSYKDKLLDSLDHLTQGLRGLKRLCYPLAANLPTLKSLTKHLTSLQYLAINYPINMSSFSGRDYLISTNLPQDLSVIPFLRGLILSLSHSYPPCDITNDLMESIFQACAHLEFVDTETHGPHSQTSRHFARWTRGTSGVLCTKQETLLGYRKLANYLVYL